jgi:drug/metabolite transporter (DMT)-like permease
LFICTAFVGVGLLALMYPFHWVAMTVQLAAVLVVAYAFIAALASTGTRRLFWAAFAATAIVFLFGQILSVPYECTIMLWNALHPADPHNGLASDIFIDQDVPFHSIRANLYVLVVSTAAAYLLPWLAKRGH